MESVLSPNEKLVIFALSAFPNESDRFIAERFGYKVSTFTAIKNRLKRMGYFRPIVVPKFWNLGFELFNVMWSHMKKDISDIDFTAPETTLAMGDSFLMAFEFTQFLGMGVSREYNAAFATVEDVITRFDELGILDMSDFHHKHLSFNNMRSFSFFDTKYLLFKEFDIDAMEDWNVNMSRDEIREITEIKPETLRVREYSPLSMELRILFGITLYPDKPDNWVSKLVGVARQTVSRVKKTLIAKEKVSTVIWPSFKKLGYDILLFTTARISSRYSMAERLELIGNILSQYPPILALVHNNELVFLIPFKTFSDYKRFDNYLTLYYKDKKLFVDQPEIFTFSLQNTKFLREVDFHVCL